MKSVWVSYPAKIFALGVVCFLATRFGLRFGSIQDAVSLVWPLAGIALASLYLFGIGLAPGVYVGLVLASLAQGRPFVFALITGLPATVAYVAAAWWLQKQKFDFRLTRIQDAQALVFASLGGAVLSGVIGISLYWLAGRIPSQALPKALFNWWAGDIQGSLYLAPLIFGWVARTRLDRLASQLAVAAGFLLAVFGLVALGASNPEYASVRYFGWLAMFAIGLWPAVALGLREVASMNLLIAILAASSASAGWISSPTVGDGSVIFLHGFLSLLALTTLFLVAANSERRQATQTAQDVGDRFRSLAELSSDWVWEQDSDMRFTYISEGFANTGNDPNTWLGRRRWELDYVQMTEAEWDVHRQLLAERKQFRNQIFVTRNVAGDLSYVEVSGEPYFEYQGIERGRFLGYRGVGRDITEQKRAEAIVSELHQRFESIVYESPYPVAIAGIDTGILHEVNAAWLAMTGYKREEVLGRSTVELGIWVVPAQHDTIRAELLARGTVQGIEVLHRTKNSHQIVVLFAASKINLGGLPMMLSQLADVTEQRKAARKIEELATLDSLTRLPNRLLLGDRLAHALGKAQRTRGCVAVMFIDLDRFKNVNDSLGHPVGDLLLKEVALRIRDTLRRDDTLARIGGDEFVGVLENIATPDDVSQVARKILLALSQPIGLAQHTLTTSASIGISLFPSDGADPETLMRNADTAMYFAKESGRNRYQFFAAQMNKRASERLTLETELRQALERKEFCAYYQPRFNLENGELSGSEALVRWQHPERGLVMPGEFIEVLEDTGLIVPFGKWMLGEVCTQSLQWSHLASRSTQVIGRGVPPVAINVSARQFGTHLPEMVQSQLEAYGLPGSRLEIELTESTLIRDVGESAAVLRRLRQFGVSIAIDDFGTGYSSLSYLRRFEVDAVKMDGSFMAELAARPEDRAIVKAVGDMAHALGLRAVAEGVETESQLEWLKKLGYDEYQGYLGGRPMPAAEFESQFLQKYK